MGIKESKVIHATTYGMISVNKQKVNRFIDHLIKFIDALKSNFYLNRLAKVTIPVEQMIRSSGILDDEMMNWLNRLKEGSQKGDIGELADVDLMQNELYWQLKKLKKSMLFCLDSDRKIPENHRKELESIATNMAEILNS